MKMKYEKLRYEKLRRIDKKQRKSICRRIFMILNKSSMSDEEIFEKLKEIIDTEELKGDNHRIRILIFERLAFLLNYPKYGDNIKFILKEHINFIKTIISHKKLNETIFKVDLFNKFRFLGNKKMMMEFFLDLEQKFNVKFDIFYKKGIKK